MLGRRNTNHFRPPWTNRWGVQSVTFDDVHRQSFMISGFGFVTLVLRSTDCALFVSNDWWWDLHNEKSWNSRGFLARDTFRGSDFLRIVWCNVPWAKQENFRAAFPKTFLYSQRQLTRLQVPLRTKVFLDAGRRWTPTWGIIGQGFNPKNHGERMGRLTAWAG